MHPLKIIYFRGMETHTSVDDKQRDLTASHVVWMLRNLPDDIKYIFVPKSMSDIDQLAINTAKFIRRAGEREIVMKIQKQMGLPLRPNESLHRTMIRARISEMKKSINKKHRRKR